MITSKLISLGGLAIFIIIAWLLSENRRAVDKRLVLWGLRLQFLLAVLSYFGIIQAIIKATNTAT